MTRVSAAVELRELDEEAVCTDDQARAGALPAWLFPALLGIVMLGALLLRVWGLRMGLPLQFHPDEWRVVARAMAMGTGDLDPHTTEVGALMIYLCFFLFAGYGGLGLLVGHFDSVQDIGVSFCDDPSAFYLIARLVSVVAGVLAIYFVYRAGSRLGGRWAGLVGAALLAVHPIHVERSHLAYPDALMVCLMAAAFYLMARDEARPVSFSTDIWVGILLGLATAAKYLGAFGFVAYAAWRMIGIGRSAGLWQAALHLVVGGISVLAGFFAGMPTFFLRLGDSLGAASGADALGGISGAVTGDTPWGISQADMLRRIGKDIYSAKGVGPIGAGLAILGIGYGVKRAPGFAVGLALTIALNIFWLSRLGRIMPRWVFPAMLCICIAAALGVVVMREAGGRWPRATWLRWTGLAVLPVMIWPTTAVALRYLDAITGPDTRTIATRWIEQHIPAGTPILIDGATSSNAQVRPNRASTLRMLASAQGIDNPKYAHIDTYYQCQLAAAERSPKPAYDIYRLSHVWFRPAVEEDSDLPERRDQISIVPGRDLMMPFAYYVQRGVEYVVVSQSSVERYASDKYPQDRRFYRDLFAATEEVARFEPDQTVSGTQVLLPRGRDRDLSVCAA